MIYVCSHVGCSSESNKSALISAYTVVASHPGSTGEVVASCKVEADLLQLALTMNAVLVHVRGLICLFERGLISTQGHVVARDDHDERQV